MVRVLLNTFIIASGIFGFFCIVQIAIAVLPLLAVVRGDKGACLKFMRKFKVVSLFSKLCLHMSTHCLIALIGCFAIVCFQIFPQPSYIAPLPGPKALQDA